MTLFMREMSRNKKNFLIWTACLVLVNVFMMAFYPYMDIKTTAYQDMFKQMPKELLAALSLTNMDFSNILIYFAYEFQYVLLFSCIYAMLFGASILSKEEGEKTIEFLFSKPITRNRIVASKAVCVAVYLVFYNIIFSITNLLTFKYVTTDTYSEKAVILILAGQLLAQFTFAAIGFLISVFVVKAKTVLPVSLGVVLGTYFISMAAVISDKLVNLKYLSPLRYVNPSDIVTNESIDTVYIVIMSGIVVVTLLLTFIMYNRKNITV